MNNKNISSELVVAGFLLALGIVLPMFFHVFGMTGPIFLPMHIPVLIGGLLLSPKIALLLGILTPLISSILTGMPVMIPMGIIMACELGAYALVASIATKKLKLSVIPSLVISMIAGRFVAGFVVYLLVLLIHIEMHPIIYIKGAIISGLPGILIQLIFIPPIVLAIKKYTRLPVLKQDI